MNLSKSKYCSALQCKKMLWLDTYNPDAKSEESNSSVLDNGTNVGIIARDLFGSHIDIPFDKNVSNMVDETNKALKDNQKVICEASFIYDDNFCSVDILVNNNGNLEIYEVKSSTEISDIYIEDLSYQVYILTKLGYSITKACIVYLNNNYERKENLDLSKLFIIEDKLEIAHSRQYEIQERINDIKEYMKNVNEPSMKIGPHCFKPYDCPFFEYCIKDLPYNNIFKIRGLQYRTKLSYYDRNIISYEDLLNEAINSKYKQQIEFELYDNSDYIDIEAIQEFMKTLRYPLYFLDFETFQQAIPLYDEIKPYMQIPFQYSLHYIESENGDLKHKEFLAESNVDPRRKLAESLVNDIPLNVCTLAYNMTFEKTVIKNLANIFPDLHKHLMNIHDNMKDLMIPFINRYYYTKAMQGSYSIKYVLPALFSNDPSLDYHNLDLIHNGSEAMNAYANLEVLSRDEQEEVRTNLLKYCELDTYAMVKIWERLKEVVDK